MRPRLSLVALSLFLFAPPPVIAQGTKPEQLPELVARLKASVGTIVVYEDDDDKPDSQGTGWIIGKGRLVTNRHVLAKARRATFDGGGTAPWSIGGVVADSKDADLVVATLVPNAITDDLSRLRTLALATAVPAQGERVFVIGSPKGLGQSVSEGIVSSVRQVDGVGLVLQTTAAISPGSSGSPVFNSKGEVVGVATLQFVDGQALNFAVGAEAVRGLKPSNEKPLALWATAGDSNGVDTSRLGQVPAGTRRFLQRVVARDHIADLLDQGREASLKGISGVNVVIEGMGQAVRDAGLREDHLQIDAELRLRAAGIRMLDPTEAVRDPAGPYLYVNVNAIPEGRLLTYAIHLEFRQSAYLEGSGRRELMVTTWETGNVGRKEADGVRSTLRNLVDEFCNDFLKANPK